MYLCRESLSLKGLYFSFSGLHQSLLKSCLREFFYYRFQGLKKRELTKSATFYFPIGF